MKQLAFSFLLAALLAGCAGSPSKEAAIEDRGFKATPTTEGAIIVETRPVASAARVSDSASKTTPSVETSASTTRRVSEKPLDSVTTTGVVAADSQSTALPGTQAQAAPGAAGTGADGQSIAGADGKPVAGSVGSGLPQPDAGSSWGDLTNPENILSKRRVLFDYDSASIRDEYRAVLEAHARFMSANKEARSILQGHADERGSREYNLALGQRRAESVFKALNLLGVPEEQMEAVSFGEEKPVAEGHNEEAWQQNRRVEVLYQGE